MQGVPDAQNNLGSMYTNGTGVTKSDTQAATWFRKAADQGHAKAQTSLGIAYELGDGVPQSHSQAAYWYEKASHKNADAARNLGLLYIEGKGVAKSPTKAHQLFKKTALNGHAGSQHSLAYTYENGEGVAKSASEAFTWYKKAAEQGHMLSQKAVAKAYVDGEGVPKSYADALIWYEKAANQGDAHAQYMGGVIYSVTSLPSYNPQKSRAWYEKAAAQGHEKSRAELAKLKSSQPAPQPRLTPPAANATVDLSFLGGTWGEALVFKDGRVMPATGMFAVTCDTSKAKMQMRTEGQRLFVNMEAPGNAGFFGGRVEGYAQNIAPSYNGSVSFTLPEYGSEQFILGLAKDGVLAVLEEKYNATYKTKMPQVVGYLQKCVK